MGVLSCIQGKGWEPTLAAPTPQTPMPRAHGAQKNPEGVNSTNQRCLPCQEHSSAQQ